MAKEMLQNIGGKIYPLLPHNQHPPSDAIDQRKKIADITFGAALISVIQTKYSTKLY